MTSAYVTRAVVFNLDPSRPQERLAYSYAGARRFAYNWAVGAVRDNLKIRSAERADGVADSDLTPSLSWSAYSLSKAFNGLKEEAAPWWREVSMHAFRSGITDAAAALRNFADSMKGKRAAAPRPSPRPADVAPVAVGSRPQETLGQPRLASHNRIHPPALQPDRARPGPDPKGDDLLPGRALAGLVLRALPSGVARTPAGRTIGSSGRHGRP